MSENNNLVKQTLRLVSSEGIITFSANPIETLDKLPLGTYTLSFNNDINKQFFYLTPCNDLAITNNLGDIEHYVDKIKYSYLKRMEIGKGMGVLFSGFPGTGKTYTLKYATRKISEDLKLPVIIINESLPIISDFYNIMESVHAIVVIDEFEKLYPTSVDDMDSEATGYDSTPISNNNHNNRLSVDNRNYQSAFLTLLDGTSTNKNLFLLTSNGKVSKYIMARPGRVRYTFNFNKLSDVVISNFLDNKLKDINVKNEVLGIIEKLSALIPNFSFDIMETIVDEFNIYGVSDLTKRDIINNLNIGLDKRLEFTVCGLELEDGKILGEEYFSPYNIDTLDIPSYLLFTENIFLRYLKMEFKFEDFILNEYSDLYNAVVEEFNMSYKNKEDEIPTFDKYLNLGLSSLIIKDVEFLGSDKIKLHLDKPLDITKKIKTKLNYKLGFKKEVDNFTFSIKSVILRKNNITSQYELKKQFASLK